MREVRSKQGANRADNGLEARGSAMLHTPGLRSDHLDPSQEKDALMIRTLTVSVSLGLAAFGATTLWAQGQGQGHGRALGAAARGSAAASVGRANPTLPKSQNGLARGNSGLNRASGSLNRATTGTRVANRLPEGDRSLANQERIIDKRLHQADHLRSVVEANGNERLLDTAERMSENAVTNYERNTGLEYQPEVPADTTVSEAPTTEPTATSVKTTTTSRPKSKGFWFRSR
jgi:hypothetical protein